MQGKRKGDTESQLACNIRAQADSLAFSLRYHSEGGSAALQEAAALIRKKQKVVIVAMGASLFASIPLQYFLSAQGYDAVAVEAGELLHYINGAWRDAVIVMVSRSGESVEIARLLDKMRGAAPIIGVTNEPQSLLARSADVSLSLASLPDQIVAIQTYTATIVTLHLLAHTVTGAFDPAASEVRSLLPAFASFVHANMDSLTQWDAFLRPESVVYLLARGASLASAYEGALLFHEVAKSPAVAMPIASFRHGPVEVVDNNFRGFVFVPEDNTRELNLSLAQDLARFGGNVRVVGPSQDPVISRLSCETPVVSAWLAPLFEIVPAQVAALRLALLRNIEPGSFRYAPQVAVDEASFTNPKAAQ